MDPSRFDRLARALTRPTSRRATVAALLGGALAGVTPAADAANCPSGKKRCHGKCIKKHRQCHQPSQPPCAGETCGPLGTCCAAGQICCGGLTCCAESQCCGGLTCCVAGQSCCMGGLPVCCDQACCGPQAVCCAGIGSCCGSDAGFACCT
jgi:hypothetical protein